PPPGPPPPRALQRPLGGPDPGLVRNAADQADERPRDASTDEVAHDDTHQPVKSTATMSGPSVLAGFMDAPLIGLANSPSSATVAPTARPRCGRCCEPRLRCAK